MCRPPTRYRRPALFAAIGFLALAGPALAQADCKSAGAPRRELGTGSLQREPERIGLRCQTPGPQLASASEAGPAVCRKMRARYLSPQPMRARQPFLHAAVNEVDVGDVFVLLRGTMCSSR